MRRSFFFLFILFFSLTLRAQYCGLCSIDYSYTSPGVYPTTLPPAIAGEYYETDLTFVLAEDTVTDFGTFAFLNYYIMEPLGMPYGLHATSDLGDFPVNYDPDLGLYGCVRICGTPLIAGSYSVTVPLIATLEDPAGDQPAEYYLSIEVFPATGGGDGIIASSAFGCSPTAINFSSSIASDGADGFSYTWDFGNGNASTDEFPETQIYTATDEPVQYIITHTVTIDTIGYSLDYIKILTTGCDDCSFFGCTGLFPSEKPDLYIMVDALGINTFPGYADTDPAVTFILNTPIDAAGVYALQIKDDDAGATGDDDNCGNTFFNGGDVGITTIDAGSSNVEISISHPVISYVFYDTIIIYPDVPPAVMDTSGPLVFCEDDSVVLSVYEDTAYFYQWYKDGLPLVDAHTNIYTASESGTYTVVVTAEGGCADTATTVNVIMYNYPVQPVITVDDNILSASSDFPLQWYYDGDAIPGATDNNYTPAIEGVYSVCATNEICTICSPVLNFIFLGISASDDNNFSVIQQAGGALFTLSGYAEDRTDIVLRSITGDVVMQDIVQGKINKQYPIGDLPSGIYFLTVNTNGRTQFFKLMKYAF